MPKAASASSSPSIPDICVIDINLPTVSGFELARRILAHDASARIIMFSMNDDPVFVARAIEIGAKGYVSKTGDPYDLVEAIREVGKAASICRRRSPKTSHSRDPPGAKPPVETDAREIEILRLLSAGKACPRSRGWCTPPTRRLPTPRRSCARNSACEHRRNWCGWRSRAASSLTLGHAS